MAKFGSVDLINDAIQGVGSWTVKKHEASVRHQVNALRSLSDAELRDRCRAMLQVGPSPPQRTTLLVLLRALLAFFGGLGLDAGAQRRLAHGIEAFRRAPADLGVGAQLYPEQEKAAIALLQNTVIQMDTGEGKTYALLPAAFALAVQKKTVYILCANEYLARRDAKRTSRFWNYVGIVPGVGDDGCDPREWSRRVVYTTITQLAFKYMDDQLGITPPRFPVSLGAVLLDDADVALLDDVTIHRKTTRVHAEAFHWEEALAICNGLVEDEDVRINDNGQLPSASLTLEGERKLREQLGPDAASAAAYLLMRQAVELAYLASKVLGEGTHYVVEGTSVHPINRVDGRISKTWIVPWESVIQHLRGLPTSAEDIAIYEIRPSVLLKKFEICAGVSGTVAADAFDFLIEYMLPTVRIPARYPRHDGRLLDRIYLTREAARRGAIEMVVEAVERGCPVLVGTHSIADAEDLYEKLKSQLKEKAKVALITGHNIDDEMRLFENAGAVGAVTVATQVAGRGVDIRLTAAARENGGLTLIGLGRSRQGRHDRQFLGRAGRHGEPFTAVFFCSLDDDLLREVSAVPRSIYSAMRLDPDIPIEAGMVTRALGQRQRDIRRFHLLQLRSESARDYAGLKVEENLAGWHHRHQTLDFSEAETPHLGECSQQFIDFAIDRFLDTNLRSLVNHDRQLNAEQAGRLANLTSEIIGYNPHVATEQRLQDNLLGRTGTEARELISANLVSAIHTATAVNGRRRRRLLQQAQDERSAATEASQLGRAIRSLQEISEAITAKIHEVSQSAEMATMDARQAPAAIPAQPGEGVSAPVTPSPTKPDPSSAVAADAPSGDAVAAHSDKIARLRTSREFSVAELTAALDEAASESDLHDLADFADMVRTALAARRTDAVERSNRGRREAHEKYDVRTPRIAVAWVMRISQNRLYAEQNRIVESERRSNASTLQQLRVLNDKLLQLWDRTESELSRDILRALARSWYLQGLDSIFTINDHSAPSSAPPPRSVRDWQASASDASDASHSGSVDLVAEFIQGVDAEFGSDAERRRIRELISEFLVDAPLAMLQAPEQIALRLHEWRIAQLEQFRGRADIRADTWWLSRFLRFLRERGAIADLPSREARVRLLVRRLIQNLRERQTMIPIAAATLIVGTMALLANLHTGPGVRLAPLLTLVDSIASGGLLAERSIVGPVIATLTLSSGAAALLQLVLSRDQNRLRSIIAIPLLGICAAWTTSPLWNGTVPLAVLLSTGIVVLFVLVAGADSQIELWANLRVVPIWICGAVVLAFLPTLISMSSLSDGYLLAVFVAVVTGLLLLHRYNVARILVEFRHISSMKVRDDQALALTAYRIEGTSGGLAHGIALALALACQPVLQVLWRTTGGPAPGLGLGAIVSVVLYLLAIVTFSVRTMRRRCSAASWNKRLNAMRLVLRSAQSSADVAAILRAKRRTLTAVDVSAQCALVLAAVLLLGVENVVGGTLIPVALPLAFSGALLADQGRTASGQLRGLFFMRSTLVSTTVDLPKTEADDGSSERSPWRMAIRRFVQVVIALVGVIGIVASLLDGTTAWDILRGWTLGP